MAAKPRPKVGSRRDRVRDPALTAMLVVQCLIIFAAGPAVAAGYRGSGIGIEILFFTFGLLVVLVSRGPIATAVAALSMAATFTSTFLSVFEPSTATLLLSRMGAISGAGVVLYVVGRAVFAPGMVTAHRVLGAIVLYLDFGLLFSAAYRLIWDFIPNSLTGILAGIEPWRASGQIMYFSFVTLTTVGFGDILPVHPFARGLANLEGIIGQLYPATLLARLITLELESRRETPRPASPERQDSAPTTL